MLTPTSDAGTNRHFSTDSTPEPMKAQLFQREMQSLFSVGLAVRSHEEKPLNAQVSGYFGRNLRFAAIRFSPHSTASTRNSNSPESRLLVSLHKQGVALVSQGGRESRVEAGDIFVIDPSKPFHIEASEIYVHSVYIKPCALRQLLAAVRLPYCVGHTLRQGPWRHPSFCPRRPFCHDAHDVRSNRRRHVGRTAVPDSRPRCAVWKK